MRIEGIVCYEKGKIICNQFTDAQLNPPTVIMGPNGVGKTTLLTLLNPLLFVSDDQLTKLTFLSYTSLKWPTPIFAKGKVGDKEIIWYRDEEVAKAFGVEAKLTPSKTLKADGYSFTGLPNIEFVFCVDGKCGRASNDVLELPEVEPIGKAFFHSPHLALVLNMIKGTMREYMKALEEGKVQGKALKEMGFEGIEPGPPPYTVSLVLKEGFKVSPFVLGDGQKSALTLLMLSELFGKSGAFVDSPEAFLYPDLIDKVSKVLSEKEPLIAVSNSERMMSSLKESLRDLGKELEILKLTIGESEEKKVGEFQVLVREVKVE